MRCCEAWEPVGKCFDPISFECTDFRGLSQIIAALTRENLAEQEAEIGNLPWTQTEKDNAMAKCRLGLRAWRAKRLMLCLHAVTDEDGHPLEEEESGRRLCDCWSAIFQARAEGPKHHQYDNILRYVQKAPGDIRWVIDQNEFDELMASKKESAPGRDGIPYSFYRRAVGLGSRFLFCAYKHVLDGGTIPEFFAEIRTVFRHGGLTPVDAVQLRLQDSYHGDLQRPYWYTVRCLRPSQRCISSRQMTDNIFEIETTALAHVACAPRLSGILLTDFAAAHPSVNHSWIFSVLEKLSCQSSSAVSCEGFTTTAPRMWNLQERLEDSSSWSEDVQRAASCLRWLSTLSSDGFRMRPFQGTLLAGTFCSRYNVLTLTISLLHHSLFWT